MWVIRLDRVNLNVRTVLAGGLALLSVAVAVRLSRPPLAVVGTNSIAAEREVGVTKEAVSFCQSKETLPAGVSAIRLAALAHIGPTVTVTALSGSRIVAAGTQAAGWTGDSVTVPIEPQSSTVRHAEICMAFAPAVNLVELFGETLPRAGEAPRIGIEYLRPGRRSWWSLALPVARRMGLGRSPSGTWIALIPILLMAAAVVVTSWLVVTQLGASSPGPVPAPIAGAQSATRRSPRARSRGAPTRSRRGVPTRSPGTRKTSSRGFGLRLRAVSRSVPRAALACGAVACLSAASWSIVTPPFQVPDEPSHFAYAQQLAETGVLPTSSAADFSPEEIAALGGLEQAAVHENPAYGTISSGPQQQRLERDLALPLAQRGGGGAGVAASEPPLYYALQTIPYHLAVGGNVLERLALMRLLSALMAGLTALFAFLFLREALPGAPWGWTVGGLGVALFPLLGFMSGAVNPDAMLCAVSAALFYCLARAFRRGLSTGPAVAIGTLTAVGLLTKLNFVGLVPGIALAMVVLARGAARSNGRSAYRSLALTGAIAASPVFVYVLVNVLFEPPRPGAGLCGDRSQQWAWVAARRDRLYLAALPAPAPWDDQRLPGRAHEPTLV